MMSYPTGARDYLERAEALRSTGQPSFMFHAALEIRCGIEARLHEYLTGASKIALVKKDVWKIRLIAREVEKVFDVYGKAVVVTITDTLTGEKLNVEYTPVTHELRKVGEKLGEFLHFTPEPSGVSSGRFNRLCKLIDKGIEGLRFATRGKLLGPPGGAGPKNDKIRLMFEDGQMPQFMKKARNLKITMKVSLVSIDGKRAWVKAA